MEKENTDVTENVTGELGVADVEVTQEIDATEEVTQNEDLQATAASDADAEQKGSRHSTLTKRKLSELSFAECKGVKKKICWLLNYIFIDGMSGMALGLFATLIAGTIIWQVGNIINKAGANWFGLALEAFGKVAQICVGAGIGIGVCVKMKKTAPLVIVSAAGAALIGSYAKNIIAAIGVGIEGNSSIALSLAAAGDPMGAFVAGMAAMAVANIVNGKTKVDILVVPLCGILSGAVAGLAIGYPLSLALNELGVFIAWAASLSTLSAAITGFIVATIMGICLTLPISSAAIGISINLSGVAAGAAVVGCCAHMIGFAVMSFRENKWSGAIAQGLGTSMLQIPNIFKKPILFVPPIITSAILGTISTLLPNGIGLGLLATSVGSGMGTAGLVGPIDMLFCMLGTNSCNVGLTLLWVALFCFILPGVLTFFISELFRKANLIKFGDLKLNI